MLRFKATFEDGTQVWIRVVRLTGISNPKVQRADAKFIMPNGGRITADSIPGEFIEVSTGRKLRRVVDELTFHTGNIT